MNEKESGTEQVGNWEWEVSNESGSEWKEPTRRVQAKQIKVKSHCWTSITSNMEGAGVNSFGATPPLALSYYLAYLTKKASRAFLSRVLWVARLICRYQNVQCWGTAFWVSTRFSQWLVLKKSVALQNCCQQEISGSWTFRLFSGPEWRSLGIAAGICSFPLS